MKPFVGAKGSGSSTGIYPTRTTNTQVYCSTCTSYRTKGKVIQCPMASSLADDRRPKRAKLQHDYGTQYREVEGMTDCFEEVTVDGNFEDKEGYVRQSWLGRQQWFSEFQPHEEKIAAERSSEIRALDQTLIKIKRQMFPAASALSKVQSNTLSPLQVFQMARRLCNPIEVLGEGRAGGLNNMFMNRSAVKLANVNASVGFALTQASNGGSFHFVDLCAAPGGFSEYLLYHCGRCYPSISEIRGIGMSLIGTNEHGRGTDWKVDDYDWQNIRYRVSTGADGTGDIYNWDNVIALRREINGMRIDAVVCDGGVDAQRDHEHQEQLAQKLVICQVAAALSIVSPGGCVVVKLFGCQTKSMRTMMKDLVHRFRDFIITKPICSRPASAERYLVLFGFRDVGSDVDYRKWRDSIFLDKSIHCISGANNEMGLKLEAYLDSFDYHMLQLNVKACSAILSTMEGMKQAFREHEVSHRVDIQAYKQAWRL